MVYKTFPVEFCLADPLILGVSCHNFSIYKSLRRVIVPETFPVCNSPSTVLLTFARMLKLENIQRK